MSMDKTLKTKSSLERHRNVLDRAERILKLKELERWEEGRSPFGLPKVAHRKASIGGKDKTKKDEAAPVAGAAPAAAPAADAKKGDAAKKGDTAKKAEPAKKAESGKKGEGKK